MNTEKKNSATLPENETLVNSGEKTPAPKKWGLVLGLYLAGIAMGALDMNIVNPARTIIQNNLGVDEQTGVWMFTIYTLAYAMGIPIIGKLADLFGRRPIYILAIGLFGLGSLGCGLAQDFESFGMLLASRVIQAIGGGGMMPVATAAAGTIAPPAKRGMALGLVGMTYGVASMVGGSVGSLVLDIAGIDNWQWIFYINVPIAVVVVVLSLLYLPNERTGHNSKLDLTGMVLLVVMMTSLLWAFQHVDFIDLTTSMQDPNVWAALLIFLVLAPVFWWRERSVERRGGDPIINFRYFATIPVGATLVISMISGVLMMSVMFIPQFAENCMRLSAGAGGYPTIIIGLSTAIGAPISGKLTDQKGPRFVLGIGTLISVVAGLLLIFWASPYPGFWSATVAIFVMGLGLGFLMGAPLTYLILHLTPEKDANSSQATLSLVRSVGTTLAPAILVGLLATAMGGLGDKVMNALPAFEKPTMPDMAKIVEENLPQLPAMPGTAGMPLGEGAPEGMPAAAGQMPEMPDFSELDMDMSMDSAQLPKELSNSLKTADVTNIVDRSKQMAEYMFDQVSAEVSDKMTEATAQMPQAVATAVTDAVDESMAQSRSDYLQAIEDDRANIESTFQLSLNEGFYRLWWFYTAISILGVALLVFIPSKKKMDETMTQKEADIATVAN